MPATLNMLPRYLADPIKDDLERKMVFLGGPRQVGKTTPPWRTNPTGFAART